VSYPIVVQQKLTKPVRRGIIPGLTRPRRDDDEIPQINPHEVLVYRVGGQFVVDDGRKRRDDGQVINAINVSVVNMQRDARVTATFEIDSMDASKFMIRANFVCTVLDAATVVRNGLTDASEAILAYLNGYQPLFELGLEHPISDVNAIRRETGVHIKAYMTMRPPELAGVSVHFANVQVDTPATIAEHEGKRREAELDFARQKREAEHKQELAMQEQAAKSKLELAKQNTQQYLSANQQTHSLDRTRELNEAIDGDPIRAMSYAQVNGDLTAAGYMEQLLAVAQQKEQRAIEAENRERELRERLDFLDRESMDRQIAWRRADEVRELDQREKLTEFGQEVKLQKLERKRDDQVRKASQADKQTDLDQEIKLKDLEWRRRVELRQIEEDEKLANLKREYEAKKLGWKREDQIRELEFSHAEAKRQAEEEAERRRESREIELEMLKEFNKRGLLDNYYPDFDDLISRVRGEEPTEKKKDKKPVEGEELPAITDGTEAAAEADESDQDDADSLTEENYDT
jgi:hypothetical protein